MKQTSTNFNTTKDSAALNVAALAINEIWYDCQDLLLQLHISKRTLQTWRSDGRIAFSQIGGKIWYKRSEVLDLLERMTRRKSKT